MSNSLERGLDILELLGERGVVRLGEVIKELSTSRATAFRMLATLQNRGYVEHVRAERVYRLGPALRTLAARSDTASLLDLAAPAMEHLRSSTAETVNLALLRRGRIVYASILEGVHALRMAATIDQEVPVHAAALGKAILASLPADQREAFLRPEPYRALTRRTITRRHDLEQELALTSARGYAVDDEEAEVGAACLAAPILGSDGLPVGAISVSGLAARMPEANRPILGDEIRRCCDEISAQLGFAPPAGVPKA
jgi:DNA-binding IclR family transcriptional regulator